MHYENKIFYSCIDEKKTYVSFHDDAIHECPICHKLITPKALTGCVYNRVESNSRKTYLSVLYVCTGCSSAFMATFELASNSCSTHEAYYCDKSFIDCVPWRYQEHHFDESISSLSPQFVKIYNQALAAETSKLDEIAGLGYRKSLEFLVKDFAIHENPDDIEKIKSMPLAACIRDFIDSPNIKTLATRSAWIGNDEAHYIRKQENRDVNDMKAFIQATVYFISMILITEDAASMEPK